MNNKLRAIKEALINAINIHKIVDARVFKQLRIHEMKQNAKHMKDSGITPSLYDGQEIIVSLTTYSRRIYQVYMVIESLLEQTLKPNRIILWLDKDEFDGEESLPLNLLTLRERGLQIEFCENLRSYKKLVPALKKYPDAIIITTDDDILYPEDFVERLYRAYRKNPANIYFYRGHKMVVKEGVLQPYNTWDFEVEFKEISYLNFPTSGAGVLYTSELLDREVLNSDAFMRLAPMADDVWFKAMSLKKGILCEQVPLECPFRDKFIMLDAMDDMGLAQVNLLQGKNDEQILAVFNQYDLMKMLQ